LWFNIQAPNPNELTRGVVGRPHSYDGGRDSYDGFDDSYDGVEDK